MKNKEIGSYFELELPKEREYHENAISLNLGRNALRYIIRAHKIKKIYVPYYTCSTVWDAIKAENCEYIYYDIDKNFMPICNFSKEDYIIYTNYFGICTENINSLVKKYKNLIIDNTMAFYSHPKGIASFYSARKFFGVSDGAYLYSSKKLDEIFELDVSYERFIPCLKKLELGSNAGYLDVVKNEKNNCSEPIKQMSKLTKFILQSIDYNRAKQKRLENSTFIHNELKQYNELDFDINQDNIPMRYPFMIKNSKIKENCLKDNIYVATYWGIDENFFPKNSTAKYFQKYIFPIPIDQRYDLNDMERIVRRIKEVI